MFTFLLCLEIICLLLIYLNEIVLDRFKMCDTNLDENQICRHDLNISQSQSPSCKKCERAQKFLQLLNHLTIASKAEDYEEQISATVAIISTVCE